jgi:hypothetical protein
MGSNWGAHSTFPSFPVSLPLGKGEAGSYPLPALKLGKLNSLTPLVSIEIPTSQPRHFRLFLAYFLYLIGNTANIVVVDIPQWRVLGRSVGLRTMRSRGHVKGVELAPTLACTLADNARE